MSPFIFTTESGAFTFIGWIVALGWSIGSILAVFIAVDMVLKSRVEPKGRGEDV